MRSVCGVNGRLSLSCSLTTFLSCLALAIASPAAAEPAPPGSATQDSSAPAESVSSPPPSPPRPPYSLPWQLRSAMAGTGVRSDTAIASFKDAKSGNGGTTVATMLTGSYQVANGFAPMVRLGFVGNSPPSAVPVAGTPAPPGGGVSLVNPVIGATYSLALPAHFRLAFFLGVTVPIGMGGGDTPDGTQLAAAKAGVLARSAMDNAMFAVNDMTVFPGLDIAFVSHGFTAQAEVTLFQLGRVRGGGGATPHNPDAAKTNLTTGLHLGYFIIPQLSLGAELRYQRWLSTPAAVAADATGASRDNLSFAIGPRLNVKLSEGTWFRPGIAYARGLDDPMSKSSYNVVQLDLPFVF